MLKKFKQFAHFFHPVVPAERELAQPFAFSLAGHRLLILPASDNDIQSLLQLEQVIYQRTPWVAQTFQREFRKATCLYLVVYEGPQLLALLGEQFQSADAHITNIFVTPDYQHLGLGSFLMELAIGYAQLNHVQSMSLEVRVDNLPAQALYRKYDFVGTFVRRGYYQDTHGDALNMVKQLTGDNQ